MKSGVSGPLRYFASGSDAQRSGAEPDDAALDVVDRDDDRDRGTGRDTRRPFPGTSREAITPAASWTACRDLRRAERALEVVPVRQREPEPERARGLVGHPPLREILARLLALRCPRGSAASGSSPPRRRRGARRARRALAAPRPSAGRSGGMTIPSEAASSRTTVGKAFPSARWKNWKMSPLAPQP